MKATLKEETDTHYVMHDGKRPFRVPKKGLSEEMHAKIRALKPKKMAEGGEADRGFFDTLLGIPSDIEAQNLAAKYGNPTPPAFGGGTAYSPNMSVAPATAQASMMSPEASYQPPPAVTTAAMPPMLSGAGGGGGSSAGMGGAGGMGNQPLMASGAQGSGANASPPPFPSSGADAAHARALEREKWIQDQVTKNAPKPKTEAEPTYSPSTAYKPPVGGRVVPDKSMAEMEKGVEAEKAAIKAKGELDSAAAQAQLKAIDDQQRELDRIGLERQRVADEGRLRTAEAMAGVNAARQKMVQMDVSVDPGRYWASRSMPGKLAGIAGLILGAVGAANDGINRSVGLLNQAIDRDLDAQKAEHTFKMQKGREELDSALSIYGMARQATQDDLAAVAAAHANAIDAFDMQLKRAAASVASPMAQRNAELASALLMKEKAQWMAQSEQAVSNREHQRAMERFEAAKLGMAHTNNKSDQMLMEVQTRASNMKNSLGKAMELIKRSGTAELFGGDEELLRKTLYDYATDAAKLKDPSSAAREGEVASELKALGVEAGKWTLSNSTALKLLENAKKDVNSRIQEAYKIRGLGQ